ncbi:MAG: cold shock domain-containing protein [Cyanobacteria bacterium J06623_4]
MTWLLNQFQKVVNAFTRGGKAQKDSGRSSIASRLSADLSSQRQGEQAEEAIALRKPLTPEEAAAILQPSTPSTIPNPSSTSQLETVPPVDTHQRLDAAPAALSNNQPLPPSFPTVVSELIPTQPSTQPAPTDAALPAPAPAESEQLPNIHDLLPATEPDPDPKPEPSAEHQPQTSDRSLESNPSADQTPPLEASAPPSEVAPALRVESAERSSTPEAVTLFSFDITEAETSPEIDSAATEAEESEAETPDQESHSEAPDTSSDLSQSIEEAIISPKPAETVLDIEDLANTPEIIHSDIDSSDGEPAEIESEVSEPLYQEAGDSPPEIAVVDSLEPETSIADELPVQSDSAMSEKQLAAEEEEEEINTIEETPALEEETFSQDIPSAETDTTPEEQSQATAPAESENPWLTAKLPAKDRDDTSATTQPSEPQPTDTEQLTKVGIVKLLFTLKKGNFHGYIAPEDGSKDILFHQKYINADIFDQIERGAQVVATVKYIEGKAYATHVDLG